MFTTKAVQVQYIKRIQYIYFVIDPFKKQLKGILFDDACTGKVLLDSA